MTIVDTSTEFTTNTISSTIASSLYANIIDSPAFRSKTQPDTVN